MYILELILQSWPSTAAQGSESINTTAGVGMKCYLTMFALSKKKILQRKEHKLSKSMYFGTGYLF